MDKRTTTIDEVEGLDRMSQNAKSVVLKAYDIARYEIDPSLKNVRELKSQHILISLLMHKQAIAYKVLKRMGVKVDELLMSLVRPRSNTPSRVEVSDEFNDVIFGAFIEANNLKHVYVGTEHLLLSLFEQADNEMVNRFIKRGITYETIRSAITALGNYHPGVFSSIPMDSSESKTGALEYFAKNMNELAKQGKYLPIFGRHDEIDRLIHILSRKNKNNPVLIGEAGVGKTAIVEGFVQRIIAGAVPDALSKYEVIQLDLALLLAGTKIRGDVEERLLAIIEELKSDSKKVVFIDEIHMIIGAGTAGGSGGMDVANILKPYLTSGEIKVIGATTYDEYQKYFEEDNALTRRFQPIQIEEISEEDSVELMKFVKGEYEKFHGVTISEEAVEEAVSLSARYISDRFLPDKALDVVDEAAAKKKLGQKGLLESKKTLKKLEAIRKEKGKALNSGDFNKAVAYRIKEVELEQVIKKESGKLDKKRVKQVINEEDIKEIVAKMTGIPVTTMKQGDKKSLAKLEKTLSQRIVGQHEAIDAIAASLKRARVGLMDQNKPLASFLFLGPTGVGKTETAKVIADMLFGDENALIQINMSEFMESHSVSKIIGSPPGYVGYSEGGQLTEKVRRKPYSVVLFDEMEKAHPDTLNILLQILEEGEIRDSKGRNVNFRNTIIVLTSNIGAEEIAADEVLGFDIAGDVDQQKNMDIAYKTMKKKLLNELKSEMRPEFLNRIDDIVIFKGLDKQDARKITHLLLFSLEERLGHFQIKIEYDKKVVNQIVEQGFSVEYGARNLRRKIQELIETQLSEMILENKLMMKKAQVVKISVRGDNLEFKIA